MLSIRPVTSDFAVAPQIAVQDMAAIAAAGFRRVVCNRPDGEQPGQPTAAALEAAARAAGLEWHYLPLSGRPVPGSPVIAGMDALLSGPGVPTLAFCRSGTRSVMLWALAQLASGRMSREDVLSAAEEAGYAIG